MASSQSIGVSNLLKTPPISFGSLKQTHKAVVYFAELVPEKYKKTIASYALSGEITLRDLQGRLLEDLDNGAHCPFICRLTSSKNYLRLIHVDDRLNHWAKINNLWYFVLSMSSLGSLIGYDLSEFSSGLDYGGYVACER